MSKYMLRSVSNALLLIVEVGVSGFIYNQTAYAESQEVVELEEYVVTGSYIPRPEMDSISPVAVINREKIERSGATTLSELFRKNVFTSAGIIDEQFTQGAAPASAGIDLRGMGLSRTLVLLDGRRMPVFPFGQSKIGAGNSDSFVDINLIPLAAVERVEILKDGASALYGADAVAGVVNIITRKNYEGVLLSGQYGGSFDGDAEQGQFNLLTGFASEKSNLVFALDYLNRSEVMASNRHISQSANGAIDDRSRVGNPGTIIHLNGSAPPEPDPRCSAENISGGFCKFDFAPYVTLIPEVERTGLLLSFDHQFSDSLSAFVRGIYNHSESERSLAPANAPTFFFAPGQLNNPYPTEPILSVYRVAELGPRIDEFETDAFNVVAGLTANIGSWNLEFAYGMGEVDSTITGVSGYAKLADLEASVASGVLNPFGSNPNFDASAVGYKTKRDGLSRTYSVDIKGNGEVIELPYGVLQMAVGAEYRKEEFSDQLDSATSNGEIIGVGGTSGKGRRDIFSAFLEFDIPVWEYVDLQIAGRMDHYNDFGVTFNPKGAIRWQPIDSLTLRANASTGFKAPALHELYSGDMTGFESVFDPVNNAITEVNFTSAGNPDLEAEETKNWGFGFAWDVVEDLNVSFDYWRIENENAVLSSPQFYVNNEASFPGNVTRNGAGDITSVDSPFKNVAAQKLWGLDIASHYRWELESIGEFRLHGSATYLGSFKQQPAPGESFKELAGNDGNPEWRTQASIVWNKSDYEASFSVNHTEGYQRTVAQTDVGSWTTFDTQVVWRPGFNAGGALTLGVDNLFDRDPPLDPNFEGWPFFNRALHNPRGRFVYAGYKYEF